MLGRVDLVIMDVSEECSSSIIRVTRIGVLGTTLFITSGSNTNTTTTTSSSSISSRSSSK
jgi:hypothetical protein